MLKLKKEQIYPSNNSSIDLYSLCGSNDFNVNRYILSNYGSYPSHFYVDEVMNEELFEYLIAKGKLILFSCTAKIQYIKEKNTGFRGGTFWFHYKDVYIKITATGENDEEDSFSIGGIPVNFGSKKDDEHRKTHKPVRKKFQMLIVAPSHVQDYHLEDFEQFVNKETGSRVHLFIKDQYNEYSFQPINVNVPTDIDLALNYGKNFVETDKVIKERLQNNRSGLFMFHGPPGTGKTTYIKYLAGQINRDFIYIPTTMIEHFTSDPNCLHVLMQKANSIIILEDAEKAIMKRQGDGMDSSAVSSLLNLSDGILSDILKTSVILTYNCPKNEIDIALRRKGRLQMDYEFNLLNVEDAKKLAKSIKLSKKAIGTITEPMSVSDIYNLEKEVDFNPIENKKEKDRVVGFGKS